MVQFVGVWAQHGGEARCRCNIPRRSIAPGLASRRALPAFRRPVLNRAPLVARLSDIPPLERRPRVAWR